MNLTPNDSWIDLARSVSDEIKNFAESKKKASLIKSRWEDVVDANLETGVDVGHRIVRSIREKFEKIDATGDKRRSIDQCIMSEKFLSACARNIYGEDFEANELEIMRVNGWDEIKQEIMVCTPRRFGKTWIVAMFVMSYALSVPNCEISIFSPSSRQSESKFVRRS